MSFWPWAAMWRRKDEAVDDRGQQRLVPVQDAGRFGVRHLGVTQGGALDWVAMYWANWLLGNSLAAPVVEVALGGFCVVAQQDCVLALAGADLDARVDDQPVAPWRSFWAGSAWP